MDRKLCNLWRDQLSRIDEELIMWGRTFQRRHAASAQSAGTIFHSEEQDAAADVDVYADAEKWDTDTAESNS